MAHHPKGDQSWVFIGGTDAEAETPIFWPPHKKSWLIGKDSDAGRDWGQEEKGTTEDEMAGWHHRLDVHEFGWTPGVDDGQGELACCDSWGSQRVGHDWATELNWTEMAQWWKIHLQCRRCGRTHRFSPCVRKIPRRRKWKLSPVFLLEKSHGQERLVSYSPWGCKRVGQDLATKQQQYSELNRKLRPLSIDDIQIHGMKLSWEWMDTKKKFNTKPGNTLKIRSQWDEEELAKKTKK